MQTLILTGATGDLGTEVVRHLSGAYDCVALHRGRAPEGIRGVRADLGDPAAVREAVRAVGAAPYGLVHLAGGWTGGTLAETTDELWSQMLSLNLTGAFAVIRETLAVMDRAQAGRIVVISSDAARTRAAGSVAYTVAKSALNVLVEQVAQELRGTRITANALMPSALDTPTMRGFLPAEKLVPLPRVAETIAWLLSDSASHVNGAMIPLLAGA